MTATAHEPEQQNQGASFAAVTAALASRGAATIAHPGGTLLEHLERVGALLTQWGARRAVRSAGLCHAWYGTDGFDTALSDVANRDELAALIGEHAEHLVYFYASCDRRFSYPHLVQPTGLFRDRFTGREFSPSLTARQDFAELTVANELDIVAANPRSRSRYAAQLLDLFTSWQDLLSVRAWQSVQTSLQ